MHHLLLFCLAVSAADFEVPATAPSPERFAPSGWHVLTAAEGDLNGDGLSDTAIILGKDELGKDEESFLQDRLLVIAFQQAVGHWKLSTVARREVPCGACGGRLGPRFPKLTIDEGVLVIDYFGGTNSTPWSWSHRYRFEKGDWVRVGETRNSADVQRETSDQIDRNFVTGLVTRITDAQGHHEERTYYELRPSNPSRPPKLDGLREASEWPAREIRIGPRRVRAGAVFVLG